MIAGNRGAGRVAILSALLAGLSSLACSSETGAGPQTTPLVAKIEWHVQPHFPGMDVLQAPPPPVVHCSGSAPSTYGNGPIPCTDQAGNPGCRLAFPFNEPLTFPASACVTTCAPSTVASCVTSCGSQGTETCGADGTWGACTAYETCDGLDNDCNGQIDDGDVCTAPRSAWRANHAPGWDTWLDACGSEPLASLHRFEWRINLGRSLDADACKGVAEGCAVDDQGACRCLVDADTCKTPFTFPATGHFDTGLTVYDAKDHAAVLRQISIDHFVIASLGDSVASGEGVPEMPKTPKDPLPVWRDRRCHRSLLSGHALAAQAVERADEHSTVTFVSFACSGASVASGLVGEYGGEEQWDGDQPPLLPPQVTQLDAMLGARGADALLLQVGANDVEFGKVAEHCAYPTIPIPLLTDDALTCNTPNQRSIVKGKFEKLPDAYKDLAQAFDKLKAKPPRIYISAYHDLTTGDDGKLCPGFKMTDAIQDEFVALFPPEDDDAFLSDNVLAWIADQTYPIAKEAGTRGLKILGLRDGDISAEDLGFAAEAVIGPLNAAVEKGAMDQGWTFVRGLPGKFQGHGYCATQHWVVHSDESWANQGNIDGTLHPNALGHVALGQLLFEQLATDLHVCPNGCAGAHP